MCSNRGLATVTKFQSFRSKLLPYFMKCIWIQRYYKGNRMRFQYLPTDTVAATMHAYMLCINTYLHAFTRKYSNVHNVCLNFSYRRNCWLISFPCDSEIQPHFVYITVNSVSKPWLNGKSVPFAILRITGTESMLVCYGKYFPSWFGVQIYNVKAFSQSHISLQWDVDIRLWPPWILYSRSMQPTRIALVRFTRVPVHTMWNLFGCQARKKRRKKEEVIVV